MADRGPRPEFIRTDDTPLLAIGRLTFHAGVRSPVFVVLVLVLAAILASGPRITFFEFGEAQRIAEETAASVLRVAALGAALAAAIGRERETGFLALVLSRPLSPTAWVTGRFLGTAAAVAAALIGLSAVHYGTLWRAGMDASGTGALLSGAALEGAVVSALATALGAALPAAGAAGGTVTLFLFAHASRALAPALPSPGAAGESALLAGGYLALGAALAEVREPGAAAGT